MKNDSKSHTKSFDLSVKCKMKNMYGSKGDFRSMQASTIISENSSKVIITK